MIYYSQNFLMIVKAQLWRVSFNSLLIFVLSESLTRFDAQTVEVRTNELWSNAYAIQLSQSLPPSPPIIVPPIPARRNPGNPLSVPISWSPDVRLTLPPLLLPPQPRPIESMPIPRQSLQEQLAFDELQERRLQEDLLAQERLLVDGQLQRAWSSIPSVIVSSSEPLSQNPQFQALLATFDDLQQQYQEISDPYGQLKVLEGLSFLHYVQQKLEQAMAAVQAAVTLTQSMDLVSQK